MSAETKSKWTLQKEIDATHPMNDGAGDSVFKADAFAMTLVGERHGKRDLVNLVRYLLLEKERFEAGLKDLTETFKSHDAVSYTCDRDGETYCDCLCKGIERAEKILNYTT